MKRTNRSFRFVVALLLVFALSFPMSFNAYALTGTDGTSNLSIEQDQSSNDPSGTGSEVASPGAVETTEPELSSENQVISNSFDNSIKKISKTKSAARLMTDFEPSALQIESVLVVNGGEEQAKNRDYVYKSEDDGYYYTEHRNASMTDSRIFRLNATYTFEDFGITDWEQLDKSELIFNYGGKSWDKWRTYNDKTGEFTSDNAIGWDGYIDNPQEDIITLTVDVFFDEFYPEFDYYSVNIPYEGYTAVKKEGYPVFVSDPSMLGPHDLTLVYGERNIDSVEIPLNLYDSFHTWDQIDNYARNLKQVSDEGGNKINDRYVAVKSLAQSQAGRDIWNVVIAKNAESVDEYLTITKPKMESDPEALKAEISDPEALDSGYHKNVIYFNNVHPDEVPASDAIMELIDTFINENNLSYDTQVDAVHHERTPGDYDGYTAEGEENITELAEFTVDEILDQYILVFNITENPDGKDNLLRTNEYGFDLNRDAAYQTQKESTALTTDLVKWDPIAMLEYHGYVDELLIEPCTGPHDPNYEYDLYADRMLDQGNAIGKAMIGNTAYSQYLVPATDYSDGWDDGAPVYGPMFAMLYGVMGYTLEIPYATEDSKEACFSGGLALIDDCFDNRLDYYENKLNYKLRGINNEDNLEVDKLLTDPYTGEQVGRPRTAGHNFFPEYYVIPVNESYQKNPLEAYKILAFLDRNGAMVSLTTEEVGYGEIMLPIGTYVIDMHQANRGFINSMLSEGYDASNFKDIYAELVISYPDMRNFDCLTVWDKNVFKGKTEVISNIPQPGTQIVGTSDKVVIQNDNIDGIRLVNKLLDNKKTVQMLTSDFGDYKNGDFVINRTDLATYCDGLLVFGVPLEGSPIFIETIVEPDITILGSPSHSRYILDMLGFAGDYTYATNLNNISKETTDVLVGFNNGSNVSTLVSGSGIGFIGIGTNTLNAVKNNGILPGFDCFIPTPRTTQTYREGLVESYYSYNNLITANYDQTDTAYVMNGTYITAAPTNGEALITVNNSEDFFKAGWYPDHNVLQNNMLAVYGYSGSNEDVPVTLFANNIFSKAHAQHTFNMFANAVYLTASDIELDNNKPFINATPDSHEALTSSLNVSLNFEADRESNTFRAEAANALTQCKYKVSTSKSEAPYESENSWLDYTSASSIKLTTKGIYYIHAYAENSLGLDTQKVFGPYNIGTTSGGNNGNGSGGWRWIRSKDYSVGNHNTCSSYNSICIFRHIRTLGKIKH